MLTFPFCLGKTRSHEVQVTSPSSLPMPSSSRSDCDSLDPEIPADNDEALDNKELIEQSRLSGSSPFDRLDASHHTSQESHTPTRSNASSCTSALEATGKALQHSTFMENSFLSSSSSDEEEDTLAEHNYVGNFLDSSRRSPSYGLDDMDDEQGLSNQPRSFTRLLSLTDDSRHSDSELETEKGTFVGYPVDIEATSSVSPDSVSAAKLSTSPKKTVDDGSRGPKKSSPLQVSLLHSWYMMCTWYVLHVGVGIISLLRIF